MHLVPWPKIVKTICAGKNEIQCDKGICTNGGSLIFNYIREKEGNTVRHEKDTDVFYICSGAEPGMEPFLPDELKAVEEGYYLKYSAKGFIITSRSEKGLFYGLQTLFQLREDGVSSCVEIIDWPDCKIRGFHLEMRFGMPAFSRILEIIDLLASFKINTLLIEYEDKFKFECCPDIASGYALTPQQIEGLNEYCRNRFIDVIPLQQTLGHMEYILKKDRYHRLREVRESSKESGKLFSLSALGFKQHNFIDEICVSDEDACKLVESLCREIAASHPESRYIHIGCDEAWNLLSCDRCKRRYGESGRKALFLQHVNHMADIAASTGKIPVIWDDMLRTFTDEEFGQLDKRLVIMCWLYFKKDYDLGCRLLEKYKMQGFEVIGAASAKCSEGVNPLYLDMPNFSERIDNIGMWSELAGKYGIAGAVTTVWSNYTGTIAPPHPFFDTIWYPVVFSAEAYWNGKMTHENFEKRFLNRFFGVDGSEECFNNNFNSAYEIFRNISALCKRNVYVSRVYEVMHLAGAYRIKSLAVHRELYKLYSDVTVYEKEIIKKRISELKDMRAFLKPMMEEIMMTFYNKADVDEFIKSRFMMDELIYSNLEKEGGIVASQ